MKRRNGLADPLYTEAQSRRWLCWLARNMAAHGQTVFLIEQLQPSWLATRWQRWSYILATRSLWGVWAGMTFGLVFGLTLALAANVLETLDDIPGSIPPDELRLLVAVGMILGFLGGPLCGFALGIGDIVWLSRPSPTTSQSTLSLRRQLIKDYLISCLCVVLLSVPLSGQIVDVSGGFLSRLTYGVIYGLTFGLFLGPVRTFYGSRRLLASGIQTVETISWSWVNALGNGRRALLAACGITFVGTLIAGLVAALLAVLSTILRSEFGIWQYLWLPFRIILSFFFGYVFGAVVGLPFGLFFGLICGLILGLTGGFHPGVMAMKTRPNQGIWLSARNGLLMGVAAGAVTGLSTGMLLGPEYGLLCGALGGLCATLWYGWLDTFQHGILRLLIALRSDAPLGYARFLDFAADELSFLQKVGGGYVFAHRYLLEYFADEHAVGKLR